jgi:DNA-binding SARP family transcriptional activator
MQPPPATEIDQLIQLAMQRELAGDIAGALRIARQALDMASVDYQPLDRARALTAVARYRFRLGQYENTRSLAQEALELADSDQEPQAAIHAEALLLLGMCAGETYSLAECEQYYRQTGDLAREIGNQLLLMRALHNLGSAVYLFRGQFDLAIAADSQSLRLCHTHGFTDWAIFPLITLAIALQLTGQRQRTHEVLTELRALAQPGSAGEGYACYVTGMLALDEDDFSLAETQFETALTLAEQIGDPSLNLDTRLGISRMHHRRGEDAKAITWAEDALNLARRVGYRIYQGRALLERGRAGRQNGSLVLAEKDLIQAQAIFTELEMRCDLVEVYLELVAINHSRGEPCTADLFLQFVGALQAGGYAFLLYRERALANPLIGQFLNSPNLQLAGAAANLLEAIQDTPLKPIRVMTLGRIEVWVGPQRIDARALRQRRAGELLALLLVSNGYSLASAQVCDALCPQKDPDAALDFFHHATSALRHLLEPDLPDRRFPCRYLEVTDDRVSLHLPVGSVIDFKAFEEEIKESHWQTAVDLYIGEFLPALRYAEWTLAIRQHLADQNETALLALAQNRLQTYNPRACLELSRQILLNNRWQEQAVDLGMRAALLLGDRATALKLYHRLKKDLENDLGIEPKPELQQLYLTAKNKKTG